MEQVYLRYEISDPVEPNAIPDSDVLTPPYATGNIQTPASEYSGTNPETRTTLVPSVPSEPFTIPPSLSGATRVLVRLRAPRDLLIVTFASNPNVVGGSADPPVPEYLDGYGADPTPYLLIGNDPVKIVMRPGDKLRARAGY